MNIKDYLGQIGQAALIILIAGVLVVVGIRIVINLAKTAIKIMAVGLVVGLAIVIYTFINPPAKDVGTDNVYAEEAIEEDTEYTDDTQDGDYEEETYDTVYEEDTIVEE